MPIDVRIIDAGYDWWDLVPAIAGGVIGALAGGLPAWGLARRSSKEMLAREAEQRKQLELAGVFRLFTKISIIVNELASILIQIEEMLQRPVDSRDESPIQRRVSAFAGQVGHVDVTFTAEELSLLIKANEPDYLSDLELLGRRYVACIKSLETYAELKIKLHDTLQSSEDLEFGEGDKVTTRTDGRNAPKLRMQARVLESLIVPFIAFLRRDTSFGVHVATEFGPKMKKLYPGDRIPFFDFSDLAAKLPDLEPWEKIRDQEPKPLGN